MKEEMDNYGQKENGKYEALTGHDDSISCLVILTHWAKRKMLKSMAGGLWGYGAGEPYDGTTQREKAIAHVSKRFVNAGMNPADMRFDFR